MAWHHLAIVSALSAAVGRLVDAALWKAEKRSVLVTTGYWRVNSSDCKYGAFRCGSRDYLQRMPMVMSMNAPMAIYGDAFGVASMQQARGTAAPSLVSAVEVPAEDLGVCLRHSKELHRNETKWTHRTHLPSLKLGCIWGGKLGLLSDSAKRFPDYDWYAWVDIGMHANPQNKLAFESGLRKPWPDAAKLGRLPGDKICVSHSFRCERCLRGDWGFCHCVAATAMLVPRSLVARAAELFARKADECIDHYRRSGGHGFPCMSEQVVMTQMALENPSMFHFIGKGYGAIAANLTAEFSRVGQVDLLEWLMDSSDRPLVPL